MALPSRDDLLRQVDAHFRELAPNAPARLDPDDPAHAELVRIWWGAHHDVLSHLTDEAFASLVAGAPARLDPADATHADYVEYWKDIADQIQHGRAGRWDWSNPPTGATGIDPDLIELEYEEVVEEPEPVPQDGSARLEEKLGHITVVMDGLAWAVAGTGLDGQLVGHTLAQIGVLRGLVRDGTFRTYDHWWRSAALSDAIWDPDDEGQQLAFIRDVTVEARIDRSTGELDTHLAGWATDFRTGRSFGRVSMAGA
jgi:hypothetical protein